MRREPEGRRVPLDSGYGAFAAADLGGPDARAALVNQADGIMADDVPSLPLYQRPAFVAHWPELQGVVHSGGQRGACGVSRTGPSHGLLHHFSIDTITDQTAGAGFTVTATPAEDEDTVPLGSDYTGRPTLSGKLAPPTALPPPERRPPCTVSGCQPPPGVDGRRHLDPVSPPTRQRRSAT